MKGKSAKELRRVAKRVAEEKGMDERAVYREMKRRYGEWLKRGRDVSGERGGK